LDPLPIDGSEREDRKSAGQGMAGIIAALIGM
jgi:hypothetical protein